jgi:gamma-glutamyl hydrolase
MFQQFILALVALLYVVSGKNLRSETAELNDRPIIGLFTQPTDSKEGNCGGDCLYVPASYVKYLESAGARVVPINYYASNEQLDTLFKSVNGIFFPGGDADFPNQAQYVYDKIVAANDAGDVMPLWGTCMGFEWLMMAQSRNTNILDPHDGQMDSYNLSIPLNFTHTAKNSRLFSAAGENLYNILETEDVTMNNHHFGIYPSTFEKTSTLRSFFNILSTNMDRQNVEFISTVEAYKYPIYGSQWHPEKNNFE